MKRFLDYLGCKVGWHVVRYVTASVSATDNLPAVYRRAELLGRICYALFRERRQVVVANLRQHFPELTHAQVERMSFEAGRILCRGFVDLYQWSVFPEAIARRIEVQGEEHLAAAIEAGPGFFLTTGHVGVFPLVGQPLLERGVKYGTIAIALDDQRMAGLLEDMRRRLGILTIPDKPPLTAVKLITQTLKSGGGVLYTFDMQPAQDATVEIEFLGRKRQVAYGMVRMAARTGALLLPCYTTRMADGRSHRIVYYPPFAAPPEAAESGSAAGMAVMQSLERWLADVVRVHPTQWWRMARRTTDTPGA